MTLANMAIQRWLNRDPISELGGYNLYRYLRNNPFGFVDPYGLQPGVPPLRPPCEDFETPGEGSMMGFGQTLGFRDRPDPPITIMPDPELSPLQAIANWLHQLEEAEEDNGTTEGGGFNFGSFNTGLGPVVYITYTPSPAPLQIINGGPAPAQLLPSLLSVNSVPASVSQPLPRR